jgi:lactoylglutathione lyase
MRSSSLVAGISHIGLSVSDLDASFKFFEVLGYKKIGGVETYPSYFLHDGTAMLTLWKTEDDYTAFDRRKNVGLHHLALKVPSLDALNNAFEAASKVEGVRTSGEGAFEPQKLQGTGLTHAMLYEPSGNRIELTYHEE